MNPLGNVELHGWQWSSSGLVLDDRVSGWFPLGVDGRRETVWEWTREQNTVAQVLWEGRGA